MVECLVANENVRSSTLLSCSILWPCTFNIVDAVRFFIASETWKSERFYKPFQRQISVPERVRSPPLVPNNVGVAERPIAPDCKSEKP